MSKQPIWPLLVRKEGNNNIYKHLYIAQCNSKYQVTLNTKVVIMIQNHNWVTQNHIW